ncbi:uncharacterized protein C6orf163 homolog isoform X2 [Halyomorpha halys]|nr:uncharacterized protein LOC106682330 isoform X2 [Halyomorpha halys]
MTAKDTGFPDPLKIAKCLISKPSIREMGQDEEKVYCGMIYGPEYSDYEHKSKKRIAKSIRKLLIKHLPIMNDLLEQRKQENKEHIKKDFKMWLDKGKMAILKNTEEELKQMEIDAMKKIPLEREKALSKLKGEMEKEIKEVNDSKKEFLKGVYQFQLNWFLKDNEQTYIDKMNFYSTVWNKILKNLNQRAKKKISELNCHAKQFIDEEAVQAIVEKEEYKNDLIIMKFHNKVEKVVNELQSKILAEELHILEEKKRGEKIKTYVKAWDSLLENVIMLFDKVIVRGFKGKPGECNYFLDRNIVEKLNKSIQEAAETGSVKSKSTDKMDEMEKTEEMPPALSRDVSVFSVDMAVDPPEKDLIIRLNLFQVKKLIEETTCEVLNKPFQVAAFMKDKSVELKSFGEDSHQESSYILNRLSDAYSLVEKFLFKSENERFGSTMIKEVPYTIETDPELKNRINALIKCYRSNPDNMRALTNV